MPLPTGIATVTITGRYVHPDGTPLSGAVTFTAPSLLTLSGADTIAAGNAKFTLDNNGQFTATLIATDNANTQPTGWRYQVQEQFNGIAGRAYWIDLPSTTPVVDLADIAPADPARGTYVLVPGPQGAAGVNGSTILSGHGVPPAGAGSDGDYWMDLDATTLYGPKVSGTWPGSGISLVGGGLVSSVNGLQGAVNLTAASVGAVPASGGTVSGDLSVTGRLAGPVAPYGVIAPSRTGPNWRPALTSYQFQAGHGWSTNGTASANLNNTTGPLRGTQYASITTDTAATQANLKKFAMPAFSLADKEIRLICRISDVSKIGSLNFYAGTSSMANYFKWKLWEVSGSSQLANSGEWVTLTFGWSSLNAAAGSYSMTANGAPSTTSGFTDLQVQAVAVNGQAVTVDVQAIEIIDGTTTTFPNGVVSIVFDDGAQSIWDYARPAMDAYGYRGTNYVIVGNLGTGSVMTTAENKQLQDFSGWEIGLHAYSGAVHDARYTSYTAAQVDDDIRMGKQWLVANGFRGESIAYPGGEYQRTTDGVGVDAIAGRYFNSGRTIIFQGGSPTETHPAGMPMRIRAVSSISSTQTGSANPTTLVSTGGLLDKCQYAGGWLILVFHKIVTGAPAVATECSVTDFQTIMAGIATRGIPVVPVSDVQRLYK
ncbi:polysaccharide deacetylase family protein [Streptomyces sp. NPDC048241]|uniref:polysaccharide deacetylase family protein n=1 Tax=Streptomyces sp. NPDC048241 TaxID=3365521 RepID=UPI00371C85AC